MKKKANRPEDADKWRIKQADDLIRSFLVRGLDGKWRPMFVRQADGSYDNSPEAAAVEAAGQEPEIRQRSRHV